MRGEEIAFLVPGLGDSWWRWTRPEWGGEHLFASLRLRRSARAGESSRGGGVTGSEGLRAGQGEGWRLNLGCVCVRDCVSQYVGLSVYVYVNVYVRFQRWSSGG